MVEAGFRQANRGMAFFSLKDRHWVTPAKDFFLSFFLFFLYFAVVVFYLTMA